MEMTKAERLIVLMLCDLYKSHGEDKMFNPKLIEYAVAQGQLWALSWEYGGLLNADSPTKAQVDLVADVMTMWQVIEAFMSRFTPDQQNEVVVATGRRLEHIKFEGFYEEPYRSIFGFMLEELGRWPQFAGRDYSKMLPVLEADLRMLVKYKEMRDANKLGLELTPEQVIEIVNERVHPENRKDESSR